MSACAPRARATAICRCAGGLSASAPCWPRAAPSEQRAWRTANSDRPAAAPLLRVAPFARLAAITIAILEVAPALARRGPRSWRSRSGRSPPRRSRCCGRPSRSGRSGALGARSRPWRGRVVAAWLRLGAADAAASAARRRPAARPSRRHCCGAGCAPADAARPALAPFAPLALRTGGATAFLGRTARTPDLDHLGLGGLCFRRLGFGGCLGDSRRDIGRDRRLGRIRHNRISAGAALASGAGSATGADAASTGASRPDSARNGTASAGRCALGRGRAQAAPARPARPAQRGSAGAGGGSAGFARLSMR